MNNLKRAPLEFFVEKKHDINFPLPVWNSFFSFTMLYRCACENYAPLHAVIMFNFFSQLLAGKTKKAWVFFSISKCMFSLWSRVVKRFSGIALINPSQYFLSGIDGSLNISNIILMVCYAMNCVRSDILYQHLYSCVVSFKWTNKNMVRTDWNFNLFAWEWICIKLVI